MYRQIETNANAPYLYSGAVKIKLFFRSTPVPRKATAFRHKKVTTMRDATRELIDVFARTQDPAEMAVLFREIFTPAEIDTLTLRWQLLKDLHEGKTQRKIAAERKISLCKITRGSKLLKAKGSYLKKVLDERYQAQSSG